MEIFHMSSFAKLVKSKTPASLLSLCVHVECGTICEIPGTVPGTAVQL